MEYLSSLYIFSSEESKRERYKYDTLLSLEVLVTTQQISFWMIVYLLLHFGSPTLQESGFGNGCGNSELQVSVFGYRSQELTEGLSSLC